MKNLIFLFTCLISLLFTACECKEVVYVRGEYELNLITQKMFDYYKGKKKMVVKNIKGDSIVFNLSYDTYIAEDLKGTFEEGRECYSDIIKSETARLVLKRDNSQNENYFLFQFNTQYEYDYLFKRSFSTYSLITEKSYLSDPGGIVNYPYIGWVTIEHEKVLGKIDYDTMQIGKKRVGYIPTEEIHRNYALFSEKEPIVAIKIPSDTTGWWLVVSVK